MMTIMIDVKTVIANMEIQAKQLPFAISKALNMTAYSAQKDIYAEMAAKIDRPTPYSMRSIAVLSATKSSLTAIVGLRNDSPSKGTNYSDVLAHLFVGGNRVKKGSEYSLVNKGQFQGKSFLGAGSGADLDNYGNIPRAKIIQLMAYFNAFKDNGYKANMTDKKRKAMAKKGLGGIAKARFVGAPTSPYLTINGVQYFMSRGKGWFVGQNKGWVGGRNQPLAAGIYSKSGTHGAVVKTIMNAIKTPNYRQMINMQSIVQKTVDRDFESNFAKAYEQAIRTAR